MLHLFNKNQKLNLKYDCFWSETISIDEKVLKEGFWQTNRM